MHSESSDLDLVPRDRTSWLRWSNSEVRLLVCQFVLDLLIAIVGLMTPFLTLLLLLLHLKSQLWGMGLVLGTNSYSRRVLATAISVGISSIALIGRDDNIYGERIVFWMIESLAIGLVGGLARRIYGWRLDNEQVSTRKISIAQLLAFMTVVAIVIPVVQYFGWRPPEGKNWGYAEEFRLGSALTYATMSMVYFLTFTIPMLYGLFAERKSGLRTVILVIGGLATLGGFSLTQFRHSSGPVSLEWLFALLIQIGLCWCFVGRDYRFEYFQWARKTVVQG